MAAKPPGFVAAAIERVAAAATRHPAQHSAEPSAQALSQAPALPRKEEMQEQFARLLAPSHAILQKLEAKVLAINQSLMALHGLTKSLAQNSQRYPGPAQVLEPPGAVEEHSLAADSAPQEVDELPSSSRASVLSWLQPARHRTTVPTCAWQTLYPRHSMRMWLPQAAMARAMSLNVSPKLAITSRRRVPCKPRGRTRLLQRRLRRWNEKSLLNVPS